MEGGRWELGGHERLVEVEFVQSMKSNDHETAKKGNLKSIAWRRRSGVHPAYRSGLEMDVKALNAV